jgi:hypothetical protein
VGKLTGADRKDRGNLAEGTTTAMLEQHRITPELSRAAKRLRLE